jgi:hypothetical protein
MDGHWADPFEDLCDNEAPMAKFGSSFRGASAAREPGIHNPDFLRIISTCGHGFQVRARARPE